MANQHPHPKDKALGLLREMDPQARRELAEAITTYVESQITAHSEAGSTLYTLLDEEHQREPIAPNDLRPVLHLFAQCMELKLRQRDREGREGWDADRAQLYLEALAWEVGELREALAHVSHGAVRAEDILAVLWECVDVANYAMIVAWNTAALPTLQPTDNRGRRLPVGSTGPGAEPPGTNPPPAA